MTINNGDLTLHQRVMHKLIGEQDRMTRDGDVEELKRIYMVIARSALEALKVVERLPKENP
jgi:hypothetical protein